MLQSIFSWMYDNAVAIFISAFTSLAISKKYYDKANRENVLMTVIFPIVQILNHNNYSRKSFEKLYAINCNYAIRYLHKNERNKLLILINDYRNVCRYDEAEVGTSCIMSYYESKLRDAKINPKPCEIKDEDGNAAVDDYPPDYDNLQNEIYKIILVTVFEDSLNACTVDIVKMLERYTKSHYTDKKIRFFDDYSLEEVIKKSRITKKWDEKFNAVKKSKQEFLDLSISRKVLQILNYSSLQVSANNSKIVNK